MRNQILKVLWKHQHFQLYQTAVFIIQFVPEQRHMHYNESIVFCVRFCLSPDLFSCYFNIQNLKTNEDVMFLGLAYISDWLRLFF